MTGPDPRVAAVRRAVTRALDDLPDGALVLVACSGGPDSLALAAATAFVAQRSARRGPRVLRAGAVVVDHGLQPGSADVADRAAAACRAMGLSPVLVERAHVGRAGGPEGAARDARYAALDRVASRTGAAAVLLGHTRDDQAETVLLGLARGSGARSLAGMSAARGLLRRPLLGLRRSDTLGACEALGLDPWHDPTNTGTDDAPLRSRVRDRVLPVLERELGPGVAAALARSADQLREDADALDTLATTLLTTATLPTPTPPTPTPPTPTPPTPTPPTPTPLREFVSPGRVRQLEPTNSARSDELAGATGGGDDVGGADQDAGAREGVGGTGDGCVRGGRGVVLDVVVLAGAADAVRRRALRAAAVAAGSPAGALARGHVLAVDALVTDWHGQGAVALPGGVAARRACGRLFLGPPGPEHVGRQER